MVENRLPWKIDIQYELDDKKYSAQDLAGKSGHLKIHIRTSKDKSVNKTFYDNYLLQISMTMDMEKTEHLKAKDATLADVGGDKQIGYMVMPGKDANITLSADVKDFEMEGIQISAVPFSMAIDLPDTDSMTDDMKKLSDAIGQLNSGTKELAKGVDSLNSGTGALAQGTAQFVQGLNTLDGQSGNLVAASAKIDSALNTISQSISGIDMGSLDQLGTLCNGMNQMAGSLDQLASGLGGIESAYANGYANLKGAINNILEISQSRLNEVKENYPDDATVGELVESYQAAKRVKSVYQDEKNKLEKPMQIGELESGIRKTSSGLKQMSSQLKDASGKTDMKKSMQQLSSGMSTLSKNYSQFHNGLKAYTGGVGKLAQAGESLAQGAYRLSEGTKKLNQGTGQLADGTNQLHINTKDMPKEVQKQIDDAVKEYDKSDFKPVSFTSNKNKDVEQVQFVLKTEKIEKQEVKKVKAQENTDTSIWTKIKNLFK
ncbi:MAG: hypothetical protein Q4D45_03760 [Lachnospiraceae bacterium]|nr:hypothetical protein [Lachnospiraceae bacterium]